MIQREVVNRFLLLTFSLIATIQLGAQTRLGLPKILNFSKNDYKAATMNWAAIKGPRGKVYFANNYGLICFDGSNWDLVLEPDNRSNITSLALDINDVIYIGAEGDMGYSVQNKLGQINYQSLNSLLPEEHKQYGLVWNIIVLGNEIYYFTDYKIYIYDGSNVTVLSYPNQIVFSQKLNGELYIQERNGPLKKLSKTGSWEVIKGTQNLSDSEIRFLDAQSNSIIIFTKEHGVLQYSNGLLKDWNTELNGSLNNVKVNKAKHLTNGNIAIGTVKDGLILVNEVGEIVLNINKKNGLRNNTVTGILEDESENLWLALGNGISYVEIGSDFYYLDDRSNLSGSVYSSLIFQDNIYIATNQGVSYQPLNNKHESFQFIESTESHTWNLTLLHNQLLVGNHDGAYEIVGDRVIPVNELQNGAWQFIPVPGRDNLLLQGSYNGIFVLLRKGTKWHVSHRLEGFDETAREMVIGPDGYLWVGHGYKGIFKIQLSEDFNKILKVDLYDETKGLPDRNWNNLFLLRDKLLFGTQFGIYKYDVSQDRIVPDEHYQNLLGNNQLIRRLVETPNGDLFFVKGLDNEDEIGIIKEGSNSYETQTIPFQKLRGELIPAFESINFYEDQLFIGAKDGLIIYKKGNIKNHKFYTNISRVLCTNAKDSIIYGHPLRFDTKELPAEFIQQIPFNLNAIKLNYSASFFDRPENLLFRTYLDGYDKDWTTWSNASNREFTNLKEGTYTFHVESQNIYGQLGEVDTFQFTILPPWYRTIYMKVVYFLVLLVILYSLWKIRIMRLQAYKFKQIQEIRRQRAELIRQNEKTEQQMIQLQMEKLKSEVEFKSRELASSTLHSAHQNESIMKVLEQIELIDTIKDKTAQMQLAKVSKFLKELINEEKNWEQFEQHFNDLHDDFIKRIKQVHPALTARDIRLCAYLRLNLASKEIAPLMGISYRGIEALRYRIRKKMDLDTKDNLMDYILEF
ncbi:MAG: hypothetical protein NXI20_13460 [bacterium]|nr:hypothetical protein [bacterium]